MSNENEPARRPLRALTVWEPWAGLLAIGIKRVENRTWRPRDGELRVGEHVAIHAGTKYDRDSWDVVYSLRRELEPQGRWLRDHDAPWPLRGAKPNPDADPETQTPYGAIIGVAVLDEVRTAPRVFRDDAGEYEDPFWCGPCGWYLKSPVPIAPVWVKGAQGLWIVRDPELSVVRERYRAALQGVGENRPPVGKIPNAGA